MMRLKHSINAYTLSQFGLAFKLWKKEKATM